MPATQKIIDAIEDLRRSSSAVVVGVSGFGGSGKSTLARTLCASIDRSARIRGDDFLDPHRSHRRSPDWDGMERIRLRREVIDPFHARRTAQFRRFDWSTRQLGAPEAVPDAEVLIIDAIGLFHPEIDGAFDLTIWVDVDISIATRRGKARDHRLGHDHDRLWDEVWLPNEQDFVASFDPRSTADHIFEPIDCDD